MILQNKTVLITGAGKGIGAAVARRVIEEGGRVVLTDIDSRGIDAVATELNRPDAVLARAGDATSAPQMRAIVDEAVEKFGALDAVVACAGIVRVGALLDLSDEHWQQELNGNLNTVFFTAKATLPALIESKGAFITLSSIAGIEAMPGTCGYVTAKHGVIGLTRSIAVDYGAQGVRANSLCPGWVRTPMADEEMIPVMERESITLDQAYDLVTSDVPMRRPSTVVEIADLCCFLVSDRARSISGAVISIDGAASIVNTSALKL